MGQTSLDDETRALITLSLVPGVGATMLGKLLEHFDSARSCLSAPESLLRRAGLSSRLVVAVMQARERGLGQAEDLLHAPGLSFVRKDDPTYPRLLKEIYDPPPLLYVKGSLGEGERSIAIVGSRWADAASLRRAREIAAGAAEGGFTVVSGLAEGVDTQAHLGALDGDGRTVAVLANGLATVYPVRNTDLAERVTESGALISERRMDAAPTARNFPSRNRIISGMCRATLVVQAPKRSGALITAHRALEEGREVFAVPWDDCDEAAGSNLLIQDGATPVSSAEELVEAVLALPEAPSSTGRPLPSRKEGEADLPATEQAERVPSNLTDNESAVWEALSAEPTHLDALVQLTGLPAGAVGGVLLLLEMRSVVRQYPGKRFARKA
ncbi:DNA-protecting protein DprA [Candidatus Poribacteria bacterium]|nr:DNA-protecting protein DprA [Candidatus Poribacteria bacterium]